MKKNILAIAIASAVAAPVAMADAPKVYGQFNMALDMNSSGNASIEKGMDVVHRNSRLGVKGSEDLGNGLKAVYQMEGAIKYSAFDADRNTFAGLSGSFGTVVMGRHDTPLRMIQPKDGFADSAAAGNNTSNFNGLSNSGEDRINNVLAYLSPSFNGVTFALAGATIHDADSETIDVAGNTKEDATESGISNAISANVAYGSKKSGIYVAAGLTQVAETEKDQENDRQNTRLTVQYNEGGILGYVMYNQLAGGADNNTNNGSTITVGGAYKMGDITPRAKIAMITYDEKTTLNDQTKAEDSSMSMAVGVDYALGKQTRVYAEYAALDENNRKAAAYSYDGNTKTAEGLSVISVGFFHKF